MPRICEFFGIMIYMYFDDHSPPHFHAIYQNDEALIDINNLNIIKGTLPPRIYGFVTEWAMQHKSELLENWNYAINLQPLKNIKPLT